MFDLLLERGETTATALADSLPITRQAVSKHLGVLERVGLVEARKSGREGARVREPDLDAAVSEWSLARGSARMRVCPPTR
jgi:DNA-binding transcriptional ArsR family regulator